MLFGRTMVREVFISLKQGVKRQRGFIRTILSGEKGTKSMYFGHVSLLYVVNVIPFALVLMRVSSPLVASILLWPPAYGSCGMEAGNVKRSFILKSSPNASRLMDKETISIIDPATWVVFHRSVVRYQFQHFSCIVQLKWFDVVGIVVTKLTNRLASPEENRLVSFA